jgi:hypothetical protein
MQKKVVPLQLVEDLLAHHILIDHLCLEVGVGVIHRCNLLLQVFDAAKVDQIHFLKLKTASLHVLVLEDEDCAFILELCVHSFQHGLH